MRWLLEWLQASGIVSGAVFRSIHRGDHVKTKRLRGADTPLILKQRCAAIGVDGRLFSGLSPRQGRLRGDAQKMPVIGLMTRHKRRDAEHAFEIARRP